MQYIDSTQPTQVDVAADFLAAMKAAGVHLDTGSPKGPHPVADGKLHRANALGKKTKKNMHVWYVLHLAEVAGEVPAGAFGDYQLGIEDTWCAKKPSALTPEERASLRDRMKRASQERAEQQAAMNKAAAAAAGLIMKATTKAPADHPYLAKKGLPVFPGLRILKENVRYVIDPEEEPKTARAGNLVVPMFTPRAELIGAQIIQPDGTKRFLKGTAKEGNYHSIGKAPEEGGPILIGEGYATAARLHEATGFLCIAAFDAGNLMPVAKAIRAKYPKSGIIICADNDRFTKTGDIENPGRTKATEAAAAIKAKVAVPHFDDGDLTRTDFDDLAQLRGIETVRACIEEILNPTPAAVVDSTPKSRNHRPAPSLTEFGYELREATKKRTIKCVKGALHLAADESIAVLSDPALGVYSRGDELVRPVTFESMSRTLSTDTKSDGNTVRPDGAVVISPLSEQALVEKLTRHADFTKYNGRAKEWLPVDCPSEVARSVLHRRGDGWTVPRLRAVISAPTLRHDGTVISEHGYDAATGLLLAGDRLWRKVPDNPSKRDALDALDALSEPINDLPFVANSDRAAALALLITAILRPSLRTAPMFAVTAPAAGTGKSLTIDIAAIMATGRTAAVVTPSADEAELEKRIGAAALAGDQIISIDNITHILRSDQLCQMLTQEEVLVRVLGSSKNVRIPSTGLICATGNNLTVYGDLNRRTIRIRLDANCEKPDERRFTFNALDLAKRKRADLVAAALTIARAYLVAGMPDRASPMGSFEDWSNVVRSALLWLNMGDCRGDVDEMRSEDPEKLALAEIIDALPNMPFTVKDVCNLINEDPDARRALSQFMDKGGTFSTKRFGGYLRRFRDTFVGGKCIKLASFDTHGSQWFVSERNTG
ncbi:toprim domain-containing protein [Rhizobium pisi]|uniref:toprim domain-containing protein n=1 Tax=Rhizobium pisi TaxID=574561 RepID=UPI0039B05C1E